MEKSNGSVVMEILSFKQKITIGYFTSKGNHEIQFILSISKSSRVNFVLLHVLRVLPIYKLNGLRNLHKKADGRTDKVSC